MTSLVNHWRRFVLTTASGPNPPLHKSPVEWQCLSELVRTLLYTCPSSRLAVLDRLVPLFNEYFTVWWQKQHQHSEQNKDLMDDLYSAEPVLIGIVRSVHSLATHSTASDEFVAGVFSWVLARLRPACTTPPTLMLTTLRRLLTASLRMKRTPNHFDQYSDSTQPSSVVADPTAPPKVQKKRAAEHTTNRVGESSPFLDASAPTGAGLELPPASDSDTISDSEDGDDEVLNPGDTTTISPSSEPSNECVLDLSPTSSANKQLLGPWSNCRLLMELLQLTYDFLMGGSVRPATVQAFLLIATVPIPQELSNVVDLTTTTYRPSAYSVLPHWVIVWLLYQVYRQPSSTVNPIGRLVDFILSAAVQFPSSSLPATSDTTSSAETVASWLAEKKVDTNFWISSCLSHLLFLGDSVATFVSEWVKGKTAEILLTSAFDSDFSNSFRLVVAVILHLGRLCVPTPPSLDPTLIIAPCQPPICPNPVGSGPPRPMPPDIRSFRPPTVPATDNFPRTPCVPIMYSGTTSNPPIHFGANAPVPTGEFYDRRFAIRQMRPLGHNPSVPFSFPAPPPINMNPNAPHTAPIGSSSQAPLFPLVTTSNAPLHLSRVRPTLSSSSSSMKMPSTRHADTHSSLADVDQKRDRSSSLTWLLNLAKNIRSSAIRSVAFIISSLKPTDLRSLMIMCQTYTPSDVQCLMQMASEVLLTAPSNSGCDIILSFAFDSVLAAARNTDEISGSDSDNVVQWLGAGCAELLQTVCTTALCMVHSSSETADGLNRGGCEGLLHAAQALSTSNFMDYHADSSVIPHQLPALLRYATSVPVSPSVGLHASSLVVCLTLTLEPRLASDVLVRLCCTSSSAQESGSLGVRETSDYSSSALLLFFPILDELETAWLARTWFREQTNCATQWTAAFDPFPSASYSHKLLIHEFIPRVLELIRHDRSTNAQLRRRILRALVWLLHKERTTNSRQRFGPPHLVLSLAFHLIPILNLLSTVTDTQSFGLLFTLLEAASTLYIEPNQSCTTFTLRSTPPRSRRLTINKCTLSVSQCLAVGKHLTELWHRTLISFSSVDASSCELMEKVKLLNRIESLLISFSSKYTLLRYTALRRLPDASMIIALPESNDMDVVHSVYTKIKTRSFDWQSLHSPSFIPDSVFRRPSDGDLSFPDGDAHLLLLANPPPTSGPTSQINGENLAKGQLRRPTNANTRFNLKRRTPGAGSDLFATHSVVSDTFGNHDPISDSLSGLQSVYFHWLRLIDRLISITSDHSSIDSPESTGRVLIEQTHLGTSLEHFLLPHGLYLPQTSITHLPNPLALVFPPSGIGLERVIELVHTFCPEVKLLSTGFSKPHSSLHDLSTPMLILLQRAIDVRCDTMTLNASKGGSASSAASSIVSASDYNEEYQLIFPCHKLILGLLMGLEAIWAGPLAPRISVPDSIRYLTANNGCYAQGIFPVKSSCDVYSSLARRLSVDYGQRRVDCHSTLFQLTQDILLLLADSCYRQDYFTVQRQLSSTKEEVDSVTPPDRVHFPLDRLLHCLTPREMAILLSDIRRNLRLRITFDWVEASPHPAPGSVSDSVLGLFITDRLPPPPSFITPGLLLAILHSHMMESGIADIVGPLIQGSTLLHRLSSPLRQSVTTGDTILEEVDVDGELMVVMND